MPRGVTPRRPAKTGRQEGARVRVKATSKSQKGGYSAPQRLKTSAQTPAPKLSKNGRGSAKGYNPVAPERVTEILSRLDQLYPDVTCALTHRNPWELLVATILSAQSTDVRVNIVTPELFRKYPTRTAATRAGHPLDGLLPQ